MTFCAVADLRRARLALAALALAAAGCASGGAVGLRHTDAAELTNARLSPAYSQWLVGPVARMASEDEIDRYLALDGDAAAEAFIDAFWARRNPAPNRPDNPLRNLFDERVAEADRRYGEAGYRGRRTARGTVYVLYGEPEDVDHEIAADPRDPPVTVWKYPADAPPGLDGKRPDRVYRFVRRGDLTEFYIPRPGSAPPTPVRPF